jgi:hypothetical protein
MQDLNAHPQLGDRVQEGSLGAVVCASGIQYLTRPEWVLAEALKVGGSKRVPVKCRDWCGLCFGGCLLCRDGLAALQKAKVQISHLSS